MKKIKVILISIGLIIFLLIIINILQNEIGGWNGKSLDEILGVPAKEATLKTIDNYPKSKLIQLFYAAEAPDINKLEGEYKGKTPQVGILFFLVRIFSKKIYGNGGEWLGKGVKPCGEDKCWGYNLFKIKDKNGNPIIVRRRKMDTYVIKSNIDDKNSYHIDYKPYNTDLVHYLRDELRKINDTLYIGIGYLNIPGGTFTRSPFILYGKPGKWIGIDK